MADQEFLASFGVEIDEGGVSTDRWTAALGASNVRRFFDEVFFGSANYAI